MFAAVFWSIWWAIISCMTDACALLSRLNDSTWTISGCCKTIGFLTDRRCISLNKNSIRFITTQEEAKCKCTHWISTLFSTVTVQHFTKMLCLHSLSRGNLQCRRSSIWLFSTNSAWRPLVNVDYLPLLPYIVKLRTVSTTWFDLKNLGNALVFIVIVKLDTEIKWNSRMN